MTSGIIVEGQEESVPQCAVPRADWSITQQSPVPPNIKTA